MVGADGRVYGLCGFSVNQTYFSAHHAQPSAVSSLACVLSDAAEGLDIGAWPVAELMEQAKEKAAEVAKAF